MTLFEIDAAIMACVDQETGEIIDEAALEALEMVREQKVENVLLWHKELSAEAAAIKAEIAALTARMKSAEKKADRLKDFATRALQGDQFKTPRVAVSYRRSKAVEVDEGAELPEQFLRYADPVPDKVAIKEALNSGVEVPGCRMVERVSMSVR